jgi:hypothetical protein
MSKYMSERKREREKRERDGVFKYPYVLYRKRAQKWH